MNAFFNRLLLSVAALVSVAAAPPAVVEVRNAGDPANALTARAELDAGEIRLSGELKLTLAVEGPGPLEVTPHRPLLAVANVWRVRDEGLPVREVMAGGREKWTQTYRLSPLVPGPDVKIKLAPLTVRAGPARETVIEWREAIGVTVVTAVAVPSADALRPPTDIERLPPPAEGDPVAIGWSAAILPALLIGATVLVVFGRRKPVAAVAHDAAWAQAELAGDTLSPDRCARIFRDYLAFRFGVSAMPMTTPELVAALRVSAAVPASAADRVEALLSECDAARFSGLGDDVEGLAGRAAAVVTACEVLASGAP